jgi:hypothetical protein
LPAFRRVLAKPYQNQTNLSGSGGYGGGDATGGGDRGYGGTSGGLGSDDTYGSSGQQGGASTGVSNGIPCNIADTDSEQRDNEYGLGSGRTGTQAQGGAGLSDDTYSSNTGSGV